MLLAREPPNVAVTLLAAVSVTLQPAVPVHAPLHPANVSPEIGVSLSVTGVFGAKLAVQVVVVVAEQLIPEGLLETVPVPAPASATVIATPAANETDTFEFAASVTVHVFAVPEQLLPLHPLKYCPEPGASVRVILVLVPKFAVQVPGQLMPAGLLTTVPVPVTATVRESPPLKAAEMLVAAVSVMVHVLAVPEQLPPLQPLKKLFTVGFSVRVTCVFDAKLAEHVPGQLIPAGLLVTDPVLEVGPVTVN